MKLNKKKKQYLGIILIVIITGVFSVFLIGNYTGFTPLVGGNLPAPVLSSRTPNPNIDGDVTIQWTPTIEFSYLNRYYIYRSVNDGNWIEIGERTSSSYPSIPYNDFGLSNGNYRYKVIGREYGVYTAYSNIISISVDIAFVPSIPVATTIFPIVPNPNTDGLVNVQFTIGIPDAIGYDIYRSTNGGFYDLQMSVPALDNQVVLSTYHDSKVVDGNTYQYKIVTKGTYGNSPDSNIESVLINIYVPPPTAPVLDWILPTISTTGNNYLKWGNVLDATSYDIYRSKDNGGYSIIKNTALLYYNDNGLTNGVYSYKLKAKSVVGDSDFSNTKTVTVQIPTIPDSPILSPFNPSIDDDGVVNVQWTGWTGVDSYDLYRSKDGLSYTVIKNTYLTSFTDSGLDDGVYYYKLKAKNVVGDSDFSNIESVTIALPIPPQPPETAPTILSIVSVDTNDIKITWTDVLYATSYEVRRSKDAGSYTLIKTTPLTSFIDEDLSCGIYNYIVKAKNIDGISDGSNVGYYNQKIDSTILLKIIPSIDTDGDIELKWSKVQGAISYDVWRSVNGSNFIKIESITSISYIDSGLTDGIYSYKIITKSINSDSSFSNIESVTVSESGLPIIIPDPVPVPTVNIELIALGIGLLSIGGIVIFLFLKKKKFMKTSKKAITKGFTKARGRAPSAKEIAYYKKLHKETNIKWKK